MYLYQGTFLPNKTHVNMHKMHVYAILTKIGHQNQQVKNTKCITYMMEKLTIFTMPMGKTPFFATISSPGGGIIRARLGLSQGGLLGGIIQGGVICITPPLPARGQAEGKCRFAYKFVTETHMFSHEKCIAHTQI